MFFAYTMVSAYPSVNILGGVAVVGTGLNATTSANANFTASGTIAFETLKGSGGYCLTVGTTGLVATSTCGGSSGVASTTAFSAGYISMATSNIAITNSIIFQSSGAVGIGNTTPSSTLHVTGSSTITGNLNIPSITSSFLATNGSGLVISTTTPILSLNGLTGSTQIFATSSARGGAIDVTSSATTHTFYIGRNLAQINDMATTTGNLIVASSTGGWFVLPVGSSGQVLTASSTQYGVSWETAAAGGGGNGYLPTVSYLNPSGASTPTSSPAGSNKKITANWSLNTLDFAGASQVEHAFWNVKLPAFTALNTCSFVGTTFADATSTGAVAVMAISYKNIGDGTAYNTSASTTASTSISYLGALGEFKNFSLTIATTSIASADTLLLDLHRRYNENDDTDVSDVRYTNGQLTCTYR